MTRCLMRDLSPAEIFAAARGARHLRETVLGVELRRFSETELAYYEAKSHAALVRALCPAGVRLEWLTAGDRLTVSLRIGEGAREPAYCDLTVDGLFVATLGSAKPGETLTGELCWPTDGQPHRVALHLPHMRVCGIAALAVPEDAVPAPAQPCWWALGDSITQGMEAHHPSLAYPAVAAAQLGLDACNFGIGGQVFDAAGLPEHAAADPALITVAYGCNDWHQGLDPAVAARDYLAALRAAYPAVPTVVLEPIWWEGKDNDDTPHPDTGYSYRDYRRRLAAVVAAFPGVATLPMAYLLPPGPAFLPDAVHPSTAGHTVYGLNLARLLRAHLAQ
jgi:lysophospholipase L1-like esterase